MYGGLRLFGFLSAAVGDVGLIDSVGVWMRTRGESYYGVRGAAESGRGLSLKPTGPGSTILYSSCEMQWACSPAHLHEPATVWSRNESGVSHLCERFSVLAFRYPHEIRDDHIY
jgi:hypothetical protein